MSDERTIPPTPQRRQQARQEGRQPRSPDVTAVAVLLLGVLGLWHFSHHPADGFVDGLRAALPTGFGPATAAELWVWELRRSLLAIVLLLAPGLLLLWLLAVVTQLGQVGCHWSPQRLLPDGQRLSWWQGCARIASPQNLIDAGFVLLRYVAVLSLGIVLLWENRSTLFLMAAQPLANAVPAMLQVTIPWLFHATLVLGMVALLDYAGRWWRHEKALWMTPAEAREEASEQAGQGRVRELQLASHGDAARRRPARAAQAAADSPP